MERGGTHFWQAPTALDLPLGGGGGSAQEAPTHLLTDQHKGEYKGTQRPAPRTQPFPSKPPTHSCPTPRVRGNQKETPSVCEKGRHPPPPPGRVGEVRHSQSKLKGRK